MMKNILSLKKAGLLTRVVIAIVLGVLCGFVLPDWGVRVFLTFNTFYQQLLGFIVPLLIFGLVAPGIADLGQSSGRLLVITAFLAYVFTLISGLGTYLAGIAFFPMLIEGTTVVLPESNEALTPYFSVAMPPLMDVMSSLILAFVVGLGMAYVKSTVLKGAMEEFREIINLVIKSVIIPLLPIYIFGIFLSMTQTGQVAGVLDVFIRLIVVIFFMTIILLLFQFSVAGLFARKNPLFMLRTMLTAYVTALGTQSSAATIPVTLAQAVKLGVRPELASFVIPLCATIHLSGSMLKITACALAISIIFGLNISFGLYLGFVMLLAVTMVAAPGVPGGAIMAALGVLQSVLGFDETLCALMIATYIAMDSFGTAANVTGDGAVAVIVDTIEKRKAVKTS